MKNSIGSANNLKVCWQEICAEAKGKNAELLAAALVAIALVYAAGKVVKLVS